MHKNSVINDPLYLNIKNGDTVRIVCKSQDLELRVNVAFHSIYFELKQQTVPCSVILLSMLL